VLGDGKEMYSKAVGNGCEGGWECVGGAGGKSLNVAVWMVMQCGEWNTGRVG